MMIAEKHHDVDAVSVDSARYRDPAGPDGSPKVRRDLRDSVARRTLGFPVAAIADRLTEATGQPL
jgi:hypothetical protein